MSTEAQKKAKKKYKGKNELNKTVTFNRNTEKVLLEYISSIQKKLKVHFLYTSCCY